MKDRIFYAVCFGFLMGVLLRSFFVLNFYSTLFVLLLSLVIFTLSYFSKLKWGIIISVFVFTISLGVFRFDLADTSPPEYFESQVGERVSLSGEVVDEPDVRESHQKLLVRVREGESETRILLSVDFSIEYKYGDKINFSGKLQKPENFITDQGKEFDYVNYLRKDGIFYTMSYAQVDVVSHGGGNPIKRFLFVGKNIFLEKIDRVVYSPESLLLGGLILGERSSFSGEMRQKFVDTGTIHIVALSGYNVSIVADWVMKIFSFLPQAFAFGAGVVGIILFVIMAGGQATAVRAGIMAILVLFARATGRTSDAGRLLLLTGVAMILWNPFVLLHDVSFQLSFIATVAVIFLAPRVEPYFLWVTKSFKLREVVSVTCAAYIFVLPFILYKMGNLSLVALPANVLILPFIPPTMLLGFTTIFLGLIHHILSVPVGFMSYLLLHYELGVVDFFARLPFSALTVPDFSLTLMLLVYAYFIYALFGKSIQEFFSEPD